MSVAQTVPSRLRPVGWRVGGDRWGTAVVVTALALAITALALRIANLGFDGAVFDLSWILVEVVATCTYGPVGMLILRRGGSRAIGWLFVAVATCYALAAFSAEYSAHGVFYAPGSVPAAAAIGSLQSWVWLPGNMLLATLLPHLLPDGRLTDRTARLGATAGVVGLVLVLPQGITNPWPWPIGDPASPFGIPHEGWQQVAGALGVLGGWTGGVAAVLGVRALATQRARANEEHRPALTWLLLGALAVTIPFLLSVVALPLDEDVIGPIDQVLQLVALPLLPMATIVAVLRHRLWGAERFVRRGLVTMFVAGTVILVAVGLAWAIATNIGTGTPVTIVTALLVASLVQPVRRRAERAVAHLLHGPGGDPLEVVHRVGAAAERPASATEAARDVLEALCDAAGLGGARLRDVRRPEGAALATSGDADSPHTRTVDLRAGGEVVGHLDVAPPDGDRLDDRVLGGLAVIAPQLGSIVAAARLQRDLETSRERLANAAESERRRLHRDLHDGLGPALAGVALGVHAAGHRLEAGRIPEARTLLAVLVDEVERSVADVRRIVDGLRPSSLEELGLVGTIHEQVARLRDGGLLAEVAIAGVPIHLPPAVEVAAFHVIREGIANVLRHAAASSVAIELRGGDGALLLVRVADDGRGFDGRRSARRGVGLASLRERVESSGGSFTVDGTVGTALCARWPREVMR